MDLPSQPTLNKTSAIEKKVDESKVSKNQTHLAKLEKKTVE
jgi:hypothetical protein